MGVKDLFHTDPKVINVGLSSFKETLDSVGVPSVQVDWRPPVEVDSQARRIVRGRLPEIEKANDTATGIILRGRPCWVGLERAVDVIPGMQSNLILHAGPPITWDRMCSDLGSRTGITDSKFRMLA